MAAGLARSTGTDAWVWRVGFVLLALFHGLGLFLYLLGYLLKDSSIEEVAQAVRVVAEGQSLISPSMAAKLIDEFKTMSRPDRSTGPALRLTERELDVLRLVAKGLSNRDVANRLAISENTVKNHVRNMLEKLQLHSRMEAVMYAVREKLVELE